MRKVHFRTNRIVPVTEKRIKDFEKLIGATLPVDYRSYLEQFSGADPYIDGLDADGYFVRLQWDEKPAAGGDYALLESPYILLEDPNNENNMRRWNDLRYAYETFKGRIPDDTVIIWDSGGPDRFLLGIKGQNRGKIYLWSWNYEQHNDEAPATYSNTAFVTNSFADFIQMIEPEPDNWAVWEAAGKPRLP